MGHRLRHPPFTHGFIDRHGKPRFYFRRPGYTQIPLPGLPWSPEFMAAREAAMSGEAIAMVAQPDNRAPQTEIGAGGRSKPGTINALVKAYLDCSKKSTSPFKTLAAETRRSRQNILKNFRAAHGDKRVFYIAANGKPTMLLTREHVQRIINEKIATPFAQRNFLNTLRAMFAWAVATQPASVVEKQGLPSNLRY